MIDNKCRRNEIIRTLPFCNHWWTNKCFKQRLPIVANPLGKMFGESRIFPSLRVLLLFFLHYWQRVKSTFTTEKSDGHHLNQAIKISITNNRANWYTPPEDLQWEIPQISMLCSCQKIFIQSAWSQVNNLASPGLSHSKWQLVWTL